MNKKSNNGEAVQAPARFSKEQLLSSSGFRHERDLVQALLREDRTYSLEETEQLIGNYKKGKVKLC